MVTCDVLADFLFFSLELRFPRFLLLIIFKLFSKFSSYLQIRQKSTLKL